MIAVGEYALVLIEDITTSLGIQIKNDGIGVCVSCPSNLGLEGKKVMFSTREAYPEYNGHLVMPYTNIMLVLSDEE